MPDREPFTFVNLFAGGGGLMLGLQHAGLVCVGVAEVDEVAGRTLSAHLSRRDLPPLVATGADGDVRSIDFKGWARKLRRDGIGRVDVLVGGPPCQSFSRVGRGKLNDVRRSGFRGDRRNNLWREFFRAVHELRPRAFLVENVPGMLHHGGSNVADRICELAASSGYRTRCALLNAAAFGVPQTRERLFMFGVEDSLGIEPELPAGDHLVPLSRGHFGAHKPTMTFTRPEHFLGILLPSGPCASAVTVKEALEDLPPFREHRQAGFRARVPWPATSYRDGIETRYGRLMRTWPGLPVSDEVTDHVCKATPRDYGTFARMAPGDRYPEALAIATRRYQQALRAWERNGGTRRPRRAAFVPPYRDDCFPEKWRKLIPTAPSWTITAHLEKDTYSHIHYDSAQARMITLREAARLQSFPDAYAFSGNMGDRFRQIGNAVPPLLASGIGRKLIEVLSRAQDERSVIRVSGLIAAKDLRRCPT